MGKRVARRTSINTPEWRPPTLLAVGGGRAIFQCVECGDVHVVVVEGLELEDGELGD
jgi:hypothetical protein